MDDLKLKDKNDYARVVCAFLAEGLRTRQVSLERSVEIADKVVQNINLLDTEQDFLGLIKELSKDFEELLKLEDRIERFIKTDERKKMEKLVQDYALQSMRQDLKEASQVMEAALQESATLESLSQQFPKFSKYLSQNHG